MLNELNKKRKDDRDNLVTKSELKRVVAKLTAMFKGRGGLITKDLVDAIIKVVTPIKGVHYVDGKDGAKGADGKDGKDGRDGADLTAAELFDIMTNAADRRDVIPMEMIAGNQDLLQKVQEVITTTNDIGSALISQGDEFVVFKERVEAIEILHQRAEAGEGGGGENTNIYTNSGILTADRTLAGAGNDLNFSSLGAFNIDTLMMSATIGGDAGSSGQALMSDGAGGVVWATPAGGGTPTSVKDYTVYNTNVIGSLSSGFPTEYIGLTTQNGSTFTEADVQESFIRDSEVETITLGLNGISTDVDMEVNLRKNGVTVQTLVIPNTSVPQVFSWTVDEPFLSTDLFSLEITPVGGVITSGTANFVSAKFDVWSEVAATVLPGGGITTLTSVDGSVALTPIVGGYDLAVDLSGLDWSLVNWNDFFTNVDWSLTNWNDFFSNVDWTAVNWNDFFTAVDWTAVNWNDFFTAVDWTQVDWNSFFSAVDWTQVNWTDFFTAVDWTQVNWNDFFLAVDWSQNNWTNFFTEFYTSIDWTDFINEVVTNWTTVNWDTFIDEFINNVDSDDVTNLLNQWTGSVDGDTFVWNNTTMTWEIGQPGGGGGSSEEVSTSVSQTGHPFTATGELIKSSGVDNEFALAQANSEENAEVIGIVTEVTDANNFKYAKDIIDFTDVSVPAGTPGTSVWLSPSSAGAMTTTKPNVIGQVQKPVGVIIEDGAKMNFTADMRGELITSNSGGTVVVSGDQDIYVYSRDYIIQGTVVGDMNNVFVAVRDNDVSDAFYLQKYERDTLTGIYRISGRYSFGASSGEAKVGLCMKGNDLYAFVESDVSGNNIVVKFPGGDIDTPTTLTASPDNTFNQLDVGVFLKDGNFWTYLSSDFVADTITFQEWEESGGTMSTTGSTFTIDITGYSLSSVSDCLTWQTVNGQLYFIFRDSLGRVLTFDLATGANITEKKFFWNVDFGSGNSQIGFGSREVDGFRGIGFSHIENSDIFELNYPYGINPDSGTGSSDSNEMVKIQAFSVIS